MANDVFTLTYGGLPLRVLQYWGEPWIVLQDVEALIGSTDLVARVSLLKPDERASMPGDLVIVTQAGLRRLLGYCHATALIERKAKDLRVWVSANLADQLAAAEVQA